VVLDQGRLVGVFAQQNVMRLITNVGENYRRLRIEEVMTQNPVTCRPNDDVDNVDFIERPGIEVPVLDGGKVVGIISLLDVERVRVMTKTRYLTG